MKLLLKSSVSGNSSWRQILLRTVLAAAVFAICLPALGSAQTVDELVARNVAARGGAENWRGVSSLRFTGRMDVGKGMMVPYVLEQKRPDKMRFEFVFDDETAVQTYDGETGLKLTPFRGRTTPEPMTEAELRETAATADLYGLLFDYDSRGHVVELLGSEPVQGRNTFKLKVTMPGDVVRWVYLDAETGLEVRVDATRTIRGSERRVETYYSDWQSVEGLLIPHRQETRTEGDKESHLLTVLTVQVNPQLDDLRFTTPASNITSTSRVN